MSNCRLDHVRVDKLVDWVREWFDKYAGYKSKDDWKAVVGISGGKDSSTVAALLCKAIGKEKVYGVLMPNGEQKDIQDSIDLCKLLGIHWGVCNIDGPYVATLAALDVSDVNIGDREKWWNPDKYECDPKVTTNLPARLRMCVLYAIANHVNGRVVGTGNWSEALVGYTTLWGDSACDMNPLKRMLADEVVELGKLLGLPDRFTEKPPSDGMCGKTDEEQLGFTYDEVKNLLWVETPEEGIKLVGEEKYKRITDRINSMAFKRRIMDGIPAPTGFLL